MILCYDCIRFIVFSFKWFQYRGVHVSKIANYVPVMEFSSFVMCPKFVVFLCNVYSHQQCLIRFMFVESRLILWLYVIPRDYLWFSYAPSPTCFCFSSFCCHWITYLQYDTLPDQVLVNMYGDGVHGSVRTAAQATLTQLLTSLAEKMIDNDADLEVNNSTFLFCGSYFEAWNQICVFQYNTRF